MEQEYKSSGLKRAYFHINNGGIVFEVNSNYAAHIGTHPFLRISASHFGHRTNEMDIHMTPNQMKKLGEWLLAESENADKFSDERAKDSKNYPFMEMMFFSDEGTEYEQPRCCGGDCCGHSTEGQRE